MAVCPYCGSATVSFRRERVGSEYANTRQRSGRAAGFGVASGGLLFGSGRRSSVSVGAGEKTIQYRQIGMCSSCGHAWTIQSDREQPVEKHIWPTTFIGWAVCVCFGMFLWYYPFKWFLLTDKFDMRIEDRLISIFFPPWWFYKRGIISRSTMIYIAVGFSVIALIAIVVNIIVNGGGVVVIE